MAAILAAFILLVFIAVLFAVPLTWVVMLFVGNVTNLHWGFWQILPGAIAAKMLAGSISSSAK